MQRVAARIDDFKYDRRRSCNKLQVIFAFKAFLHDLHVQHAEEATTKAKSQCGGRFRLEMQCRIVQAQLLQCLTKILIVIRADRE